VKTNDGFKDLVIKGLFLIFAMFFAIFYPDILIAIFTYKIVFFRIYHVLWLLTILILIKRLIPRFNKRINLGKIYGKYYVSAGEDNPKKQKRLKDYIRKMNFGAMRTAVYWIALVLMMGFWHLVGLLNTMWLCVIVVFFIFMDQFCTTVWCPFKAIIQNKCCNTCRINNWGYLMAFSPLIYAPSFWAYSIIGMSIVTVIQWEYLIYKHPERFYELYNASLMCKNCVKKCKKMG
jgi:hypothetical protein